MKKISFCLVILTLATLLCSCSALIVARPSAGVWYNEELNISMEFFMSAKDTIVKRYESDSREAYSELSYAFTYFTNEMVLYYEEEIDGKIQRIDVYRGVASLDTGNLKFTVSKKMNPDDPTGDPLEVEESYIFVRVDENFEPMFTQKAS